MNHLYFLWTAVRSLYLSYGQYADGQEQRAVETYLAGASSVSDLEYRERQWMRAHS